MGIVSWIKRRYYLNQADHLGKPMLTSSAVKFFAGKEQELSVYVKIILDFLMNGLPLGNDDIIETNVDNITITHNSDKRGHFVNADEEYDRVFTGISELIGETDKDRVAFWNEISKQTGRKWSVTAAPIVDAVTWRYDTSSFFDLD